MTESSALVALTPVLIRSVCYRVEQKGPCEGVMLVLGWELNLCQVYGGISVSVCRDLEHKFWYCPYLFLFTARI